MDFIKIQEVSLRVRFYKPRKQESTAFYHGSGCSTGIRDKQSISRPEITGSNHPRPPTNISP